MRILTRLLPILARWCELVSQWIGRLSALLLLLLVANVFYDVVMRYVFNDVSIGMQELEWHLYSAVFLFGMSYTLSVDGHVRVDFIYERLSPRRRAVIDLAGTLLFVLPFCILIAIYGSGFSAESLALGETSGDPGGLPQRWLVKALIPVAFVLVVVSAIGFMARAMMRVADMSGTVSGDRP